MYFVCGLSKFRFTTQIRSFFSVPQLTTTFSLHAVFWSSFKYASGKKLWPKYKQDFFWGGGVGLFISLGSHNSNVLNSLSSDVCYTNKQINNQKTLPVIQTNGEKWIYEDMIEQSKSS